MRGCFLSVSSNWKNPKFLRKETRMLAPVVAARRHAPLIWKLMVFILLRGPPAGLNTLACYCHFQTWHSAGCRRLVDGSPDPNGALGTSVVRKPRRYHIEAETRCMAAIFQTTFSNAFSWMKMFKFRLRCHWTLFPSVQLTIFQHWFR